MTFFTGLDKVFLAPQASAAINASPDSFLKHFTSLWIYILWGFLIIADFYSYLVRNHFCDNGHMCWGQFVLVAMVICAGASLF
jgi:cytochrome c oxidase subunit IV